MVFQFRTELQIHAKMRHPFIVEFYRAFSFESHTYVVLELCPNGSLMEMVKSRASLSLPEVRRYMIQLCGGVKYMHKRCVIHRDLKMGNVFLDSHMDVKIGDFGLAAVVLDDKERRQTLCGTPNYIAPEILNKSQGGGHDNKVDTWAIGIICYAMLIGTPPFASKTQAEIYQKLKQLQYDWKEADSQNFIPMQVKQLVSSCLNLDGSKRPEMDDLVDHDFFKIGAVAEELEPSCRTSKPAWLEMADPRGDRVRPGYGVDYQEICRLSGVGKDSYGQPLAPVGGIVTKSAMVEVELENSQGCAPVIPLSEGVVYEQFTAARKEWVGARKFPVRTAVPNRKASSPPLENALDSGRARRTLREAVSRPVTSSTAAAVAPRLPVPSFAAQQRQQALPTRIVSTRVPSPEESKAHVATKAVEDEPVPSRAYLRERPLRAPTARTSRSNTTRDATVETQRPLPKSKTISGGMNKMLGDIKSALAEEEPAPPARARIMGRSASHRVLPTNTIIRSESSDDSSGTRPDSSSPSKSETLSRVLHPTSGNDRRPPEAAEKLGGSRTTLRSVQIKYRPHLVSTIDIAQPVPGSKPLEMLAGLRRLHESLTPSSASCTSTKSSTRALRSSHPVVDKWVDYTNKYGIAYMLSDNTCGVVFKSSDDNSKGSQCIVVRNGRAHYVRRTLKRETQVAPQGTTAGPIEFFEQCSEAGMLHVTRPAATFKLDTEAHGENMSAAVAKLTEKLRMTKHGDVEVERMKLVVLADKFGKYMTKTLGPEEAVDGTEAEISASLESKYFCSFYQKLGNVGVWGFGVGGFQFSFPDHTKIVIYTKAEEVVMDLYHLQPEDADHLSQHGTQKEDSLPRRNLLTIGVRDVLDDVVSADARMRRKGYPQIVESNEVREKLAWVRGVVGCWIKEGGVGRIGGERLGWDGLQERTQDGRPRFLSKMAWVNVGRAGGDGDGDGVVEGLKA